VSAASEIAMPRRHRRRRAVIAVIGVVVLAAGYFLYSIYAWKWELQKAVAEADRLDPGWRLQDLDAAREPVSDADNSALVVLAAAALMPKNWGAAKLPDGKLLEERVFGLKPGEALSDPELNVLRAELTPATAALSTARDLAEMPRGRYSIAWSNDFVGTLVPHLDAMRNVARLLNYDVVSRIRDGDRDGALWSCRAVLNTGRSVGDEPCVISQRVRVFCTQRAVRSLERTLAAGTVSAESLEALQKLLADEAEQPLLLRAARAERVAYFQALEVMRSGQFNRAAYGVRNSILGATGDDLVDQSRARASEAAYLRWTNAVVEIAKQPSENQNEMLEKLEPPSATLPTLISALSSGNDMARQARVFNRSRAELRCAATALAAERYRLAENRWPEKLGDLVPRYLKEVPSDPFDGQSLRMRHLDDGLVVYSVGADRQDNGGTMDLLRPEDPGTDVGFELRNATKRGLSRVVPAAP
jgi:hypothetical protein